VDAPAMPGLGSAMQRQMIITAERRPSHPTDRVLISKRHDCRLVSKNRRDVVISR
jgi:hypothetical protein